MLKPYHYRAPIDVVVHHGVNLVQLRGCEFRNLVQGSRPLSQNSVSQYSAPYYLTYTDSIPVQWCQIQADLAPYACRVAGA